MAEQWQLRRGTTAQNETFTGAVGEITMDTDATEVRIHDGSTIGGHILAKKSYVANILNTIYPIGAIYIGTQSTCPMSTVMPGTTWTLVSSGKALWTGDGTNGNTTIAAGLPNITGTLQALVSGAHGASGAFASDSTWNAYHGWNGDGSGAQYSINASRSSSIYGSSNTVQPPAYVVNVWRRSA